MRKFIALSSLIIQLALNSGYTFGQWTQSSNGLGTDKFCYAFAVSGSNIYTGTLNTGVYKTTDNGNLWSQTALNNKTVFSLAATGSNVFAGIQSEGVYLSTNSGSSWTQSLVNSGSAFALNLSGANVYAGLGPGGVYFTSNNGSNWSQIGLTDKSVFSIAVSGITVFAGTSGSGVFTTTNNGVNWTPTPLNSVTVYGLTVSGTNIFAGTASGVYLSTNNGSSWSPTSLSSAITVRSITSSGINVFAGTSGSNGVYFTSNNGTAWVQKNQGLPSANSIMSLLIDNNFIYAGTFGQSVYKRTFSEIINVRNISSEVPSAFSFDQNYPNPFNPVTKIKFAVMRTEDVKLTVYDIKGREVNTLVNGSLNPGTYEAVFDASEFSSGIYFYKLSTPSFSETMKMILQK
ncbi:MAG: T9SS type A sorting domain-containing protein [Bacteroidetes bacterium]|nr:T9SS type A sorting domain-containing protein [Bacteroidota bacterium]